MRILFAFLLALIFISLNEAKVSKGQFKQLNDDWHYLDKFCFDTSGFSFSFFVLILKKTTRKGNFTMDYLQR